MRPIVLAIAVLPALLLVGCNVADDTDGGQDGDDTHTSDSSGIDSDSGSFQLNVGGPGVGPVPASFDLRDFAVDENATGVLVEARWSCASPTCTLDVLLLGPDGEELVRAPGSGEVSFFLEDVVSGAYRYGVEAAVELVVEAQGDVAMSAFYGSASAEGFSAFHETGPS